MALIAGLAGPLAYSSSTVTTTYTGAIPVAGPAAASGGLGAFLGAGGSAKRSFPGAYGEGSPVARGFPRGAAAGAGGRSFAEGGGGGGLLGRDTQVSSALTKLLKDGAAAYTWVAATVGAESAAPFQLASGDPIMAIGGFNGTDPAPTLAQFEKYVSEHKIHYFIGRNQASFGGGTEGRGADHRVGAEALHQPDHRRDHRLQPDQPGLGVCCRIAYFANSLQAAQSRHGYQAAGHAQVLTGHGLRPGCG